MSLFSGENSLLNVEKNEMNSLHLLFISTKSPLIFIYCLDVRLFSDK